MKTLFTVVWFMLFACSITEVWAQDYVYSVTTGTSWARDAFPKQERKERKQREGKPLLPGAPNFEQTFQEMRKDYQLYNSYNDSIFLIETHEEWIGMFGRRARKYSQIYDNSNQRITALRDYFDRKDVPDAAYDSLFYWTRNYYHRNINDIYLFEQLLDILIPHYEAKHDVEHLIFCYACAGMSKFQNSRIGERDDAKRSAYYYQKILSLQDHFPQFTDPLNRFYFIAAFVNLSTLHTQAGFMSLSEGNRLVESMHSMFAKPEVQTMLQADSLLNEFARWSIDVFRYRGIMTYISLGLDDPELKASLYKSYQDIRKEIKGDFNHLANRYYAKLEYDDLIIEAFMGNISWDKAQQQFEKLLKRDADLNEVSSTPTIKINYLNNLFQSHLYLLDHASLSDAKKESMVKEVLNYVLEKLSQYEHGQYTFEKGMILANMATHSTLLKYLNTRERRNLLFRLIVLEQPTTYVHTSMVAALSRILATKMIAQHPDYFIGVPGYHTTADVQQKSDSLLDFIHQAAIYHDLGKISMPQIINNCFRKLTQHEFDIIKLHSEKSLPFFMIDESFRQYEDVALGHHKWFDGDGYPASFKNRQSPYFPIINLVTICDCMDAATENIGRNYHHPKSFEAIMEEFSAGAGTHYDPLLVNTILQDQMIYDQMKQTVNTGRYDYYYMLYRSYFDK